MWYFFNILKSFPFFYIFITFIIFVIASYTSMYVEDAIVSPLFPSRVNKRTAIIFAVSRTANVSGRITFLIVSIYTMNGIRMNTDRPVQRIGR